MRRAGLLLILPLLWPVPAPSQTNPPIAAVKPLVDAWRACALDKGRTFMRSGESAEVVAKVALYECRDQRQVVADAIFRTVSATAGTAMIEQLEADIRDLIVSIIVQAKSAK